MLRPSSLSRSLGVLALIALATGSIVEPVVGTLRDDAVHHETAAAADAHRQVDPPGDHGHEDGAIGGPRHQHGRHHEHGTATDHCTHAHGAGLPVVPRLAFSLVVFTVHTDQPVSRPVAPSGALSPPPKA